MAAGLEYQVISKIVELQDFSTAQRLKITEDFFFSPECKTIFHYIWDHFHALQTFGSVPSFQIVGTVFPGFQYSPSPDSLETLCEQLRLAKMRVELLGTAERLQQLADYNPREGLDYLRHSSAQLASRHETTDDMVMSSAYEVLSREYELVASGRGITGLPWPWPELNAATQGIHPGDFIIIYGRPKNMKTWISLYVTTIINMYANARVLVCSFEMDPVDIIRRSAAIRAVVDYKKLKAGQLQPFDRERFFAHLQHLHLMATGATVGSESYKEFLVTSGKGSSGISFVHSKIEEFKPHLVLIDGMYLMEDDRQKKRTVDWKAIAHISQDMKRTAKSFKVPVIANCQANRKAEKNAKDADLAEIAYTDAIGQDCDFSIRVQKRKDKSTGEPELALGFPGGRETDLDSLLIHGIPAVNFSLKSTIVLPQEDDSKKKGSGNGKQMPTISFRPKTT